MIFQNVYILPHFRRMCHQPLCYDFIVYSVEDTWTLTQLFLYRLFHWRLNRVFFTNI